MGEIKRGLEGVTIGESSVSSIDGKRGKLIYRGYDIADLATYAGFEEVVYLLWYGKLPNRTQLKGFQKKLRSMRAIPKSSYTLLKQGIKQTDSMDVLNTMTTYLGQVDRDLNHHDRDAVIRKAMQLTAQFPTIVAAYWRLHQGKKPIAPKKNLGPGANFLYMLHGKMPTELEARAMEIDFILTAEHGINASTFATMVATATMSDYHSAIASGVSTLKGPLHGAARRRVFEMLDDIKHSKHAEKHIMQKIRNRERIMGFGHRVYKAYDPRAEIFRATAKLLAEDSEKYEWYTMSEAIENVVLRELVKKKKKPIWPNVDFWTGAVYHYLGIPAQLTTGIFAVGRVPGWTAHILEQAAHNRLIRPKAKYIGKKSTRYVPLEKRR